MKGQQDLDVTAMIFDHVGDSYWWHLTDVGQTSVAMPLPVLVYSEHTGWHAFSSARFPGSSHWINPWQRRAIPTPPNTSMK